MAEGAASRPLPALFLSRVERFYTPASGRLDILKGASLAVWPGEMVALVAPSGTGKSTLLHVAGLLEKPDAGEVFVSQIPTSALDDAGRTALRRTEIGFVYQSHHLLPEFSALENVTMPQRIAGLDAGMARDRAVELLRFLGLGERLDHRPAELSGGEQQRVALARAVANGPRLLLADEPTGNLDPEDFQPCLRDAGRAGARLRPRRAHRHAQHGSGRADGSSRHDPRRARRRALSARLRRSGGEGSVSSRAAGSCPAAPFPCPLAADRPVSPGQRGGRRRSPTGPARATTGPTTPVPA